MLRTLAILVTLVLSASLDGADSDLVIGPDGASVIATKPEDLVRTIRFASTGPSGLETTFVATSLRGVIQDDWRTTQRIAGRRTDSTIDQPMSMFGSAAERQEFGILGRDADWDNFAVQWDGVLRVPAEGVELATASDDGSRLWLDLDRDGRISAEEWGSNGWGTGQGTTQRVVHAQVPGGRYDIRVQFEEGGGGNACTLLWRKPGGGWAAVPAEGFNRMPFLNLGGPLTLRSQFDGAGDIFCSDGVILASVPASGTIHVSGTVRLANDLTSEALLIRLQPGARLELAGHQLTAGHIIGPGTVDLGTGRLIVASTDGCRIAGSGMLRIANASTLSGLDMAIQVDVAVGGSVHAPERIILATALAGPITTVVPLGEIDDAAAALRVTLDGPLHGAGLLAWRADRHGRWFQRQVATPLRDGRQELEIDLSANAELKPEGHAGTWNPASAAESGRAGVIVYSDQTNRGAVRLEATWHTQADARPVSHLCDIVPAPAQVETGRRIELSARPEPFPLWPLDPACFDLRLLVTGPDDAVTTYAGFADQPYRRIDAGDRESLVATGSPRFAVRFRAKAPGRHRLRLLATWADGTTANVELPDIHADGPEWDDIARPDAGDPRFLSAQQRVVWPVGQNLNSTYDVRSQACLQTKLTTDRGSFTREAFLARLISAGGTGCETWLSPWNLGLEWSDAWRGFHGTGRPNLGNAWALDRFLEQAEAGRVRVVLSIFNHGQGRDGSGAEDDFPHHPWRSANGGWLDNPAGLFTDARAKRGQENLFRYLAARCGDSPAVLAWKLWAEVNLVHAPLEDIRTWHTFASEAFARHDPWRHPVTTHWCGDWRNADHAIAIQPGMGMLTIDAYHDEGLIADLLAQSTRQAGRDRGGLAVYAKPVLVTEYGGSPSATTPARLLAELQIGGWAAWVHGHAGAPMMWWFEWIDQKRHYGQFGALNRFIAGEDPRSPDARTITPDLRAGGSKLWCRAWMRPGRILGYAFDPAWAENGTVDRQLPSGELFLGDSRPGRIQLEWWDADQGRATSTTTFDHPGGDVKLPSPGFRRHVAFKLWRVH